MWGTTLIIDSLAPGANHDDLRVKKEDTLLLSWEERRWTRGRFTTAQGRRIGIALPTGTALAPGAILHIADDWYLKIEAAMEPVLEIVPADYQEAVKIAFEVGNRHFPLALEENKILVPDDKGMIRLMDRLGVVWKKRQAIFNPISNTQLQPHGFIS